MTSSDRPAAPAAWSVDPLLSSQRQKQAFTFVRSAWDEASAQGFGPWRISPKPDPAESQSIPTPQVIAKVENSPVDEPASLLDEPSHATEDVVHDAATHYIEPDPAALKALEESAYKKGLIAGRQLEQQALKSHREQERELIRNLSIELRGLQQNPERFFEPLKKLSMHVAEILVRNELQISEQAIKALIEACISQLDTTGDPVTVSLNPSDFKVLQATGEASSLKLVEDPNLRPGSVKAQVQDTLVQDLIEHRLEPLARKILSDPDNWLQRSTLLHDVIDAMPDDASPRSWSSNNDDIVDMPEPLDPKGPPGPPDPKEPM